MLVRAVRHGVCRIQRKGEAGTLKKSDIVTIIGQSGDFYRIFTKEYDGYAAKRYIRLKSQDFVKSETGDVYFYDSTAQKYVSEQKTYYRAVVPEGDRQFDGALTPDMFDVDGDGKVVAASWVKSLSKRMGVRLFKSEKVRVTILFGQYYPNATDDETIYVPGIHEGIDFAGPETHAPFYALTDGVVTVLQESSDNDEYSYIGIECGDRTVFYVHGSEYFAKVGDTVKSGQKLGLQGDMGAPGAYHVHVEVDEKGAKHFKYSKNTALENTEPYSFWKKQLNQAG